MSHEMGRWQALQDEYIGLLLDENAASAIERTRQLLAEGVTPLEFFQQIITPALTEVGRRFEELEIFLPELAIAGETVKEINDAVITPALEAASQVGAHRAAALSDAACGRRPRGRGSPGRGCR